MSEPISVLIADEMSKSAVEILREAGFSVDVKTGMKPEELAGVIGNYHGLGIRSASKVTAAVLANPGKLKIIGRAGVGVDNIDVTAASAKDILVINTPAGNSTAAAELAVGLIFALARKIPQAAGLMRQGSGRRRSSWASRSPARRWACWALGNIGRQVAERGVGLKMRVIGHDPVLSPDAVLPAGVETVTFHELVERSDFLTLHVPLTKDTKNLFDGPMLAKMKKGACLINAARGGIVNEEALLEALKSGQLGGRGAGRVRQGAAGSVAAVRAREPDRRAPPGRVDQRGAGEGRGRAGRGVRVVSEGRRRSQRRQSQVAARTGRRRSPKDILGGHGGNPVVALARGDAGFRAARGRGPSPHRRDPARSFRALGVRARHHARVRIRGRAGIGAWQRRARVGAEIRGAEFRPGGGAASRHHAADRAPDRHAVSRRDRARAPVLRGDRVAPRSGARDRSAS